ncbi:MAG: 23S rRNA (uracil(1939)-C(5))-methyltransferase RlmD [Clostridia bacterium]|nr:23S rRNA (uracil(1939)-C(5))-methyltransferase RlmD [Clostridia bacterium]
MVEKNKEYVTEVLDLTHEGLGVAKVEGFAVFVEGALPREQIRMKIVKVTKNFAYGKLLEILEPSSKRRPVTCDTFKKCGGCALCHMSYPATLEFKRKVVRDSFLRIGHRDVAVEETIGMEEPYFYRNKVQFPVGLSADGKVITGFYANRTHDIVSVNDCSIQSRIANKLILNIREFLRENKVPIYDEKTQTGLVRHVIIRNSEKTGEVMVILVTKEEAFAQKEAFVSFVLEKCSKVVSIMQNINPKNTNVILGEKNIRLYGKDTIKDYIGEFSFNISPNSFFQVNARQTEVLYRKALEFADLSGNETVFDLYCGIGSISLFLAKKAKRVYGVEVVKPAVQNAKENAKENGITNAVFYCGKAEEVVPKLYSEGIRADVVVVDPPRSGCDKVLIDTILEMKPKKIVYVSCNPGTLARDVAALEGYEVKMVQPVDMFPWSFHVETVVEICKVETL